MEAALASDGPVRPSRRPRRPGPAWRAIRQAVVGGTVSSSSA